MATDTEVLHAVNELTITPALSLGYNAADDLIRIKKTVGDKTYLRIITDPDIADNVVDRWVDYGAWAEV